MAFITRYVSDRLPQKWDQAREVVEDSLRNIRKTLNGGFRWQEQVRNLVETELDPSELPQSVEFPNVVNPPLTVLCLRAVVVRTEDGKVLSGLPVTWEFRGGTLFIHEIDGLLAGTRYRVTLAAME